MQNILVFNNLLCKLIHRGTNLIKFEPNDSVVSLQEDNKQTLAQIITLQNILRECPFSFDEAHI